MLALKLVRDFQAIALLTRCLFELSVDVKLIEVIPDAVEKILVFDEVEKVRAAEKIVAFKKAHPDSRVDATIHEAFVANHKARADAARNRLWPGQRSVAHWSGKSLRDRVAELGPPFLETYEVKYPQMSWYTHSAGVIGLDLKSSSYPLLVGTLFQLAGECYMVLLTTLAKEFRLTAAVERIESKMKFAQLMPFTDTDEELQALERSLLA